jgi:hypothetical protein
MVKQVAPNTYEVSGTNRPADFTAIGQTFYYVSMGLHYGPFSPYELADMPGRYRIALAREGK